MTKVKRFKQEVIDRMLNDADLYALVAKEKSVKPANLGTVIRRNGGSINEYRVVKTVADYLGVDPEELMVETQTAA